MHYYKNGKENWYYNDRAKSVGSWYYDHVTVSGGTGPKLVEAMRVNMKNE